MRRPSQLSFLFHALFFLSGGAGLGYQIVWTKMFATGLGHEFPALLAIVCGFMGGMGLGAWSLDKAIAQSPRPGRWYGLLEILIGGWGLLSAALIPFINESASHIIGLEPSAARHWTVAFFLPFIAILPATAAMGATLPAIERLVSPLKTDGRCVGALYAANTFGAVAGTLLSAFVIMPALGLRQTVCLLAVVNLLCGVIVLFLNRHLMNLEVGRVSPSAPQLRRRTTNGALGETPPASGDARPMRDVRIPSPCPLPAERGEGGRSPEEGHMGGEPARMLPPSANCISKRRINLTVFLTGLLGIGYETVGVRMLSQILENTIYTFAAVLAVFLLGTAVGAALFQRVGRVRPFHPLLTDLLGGLSASCVVGMLILAQAQPIYDACRAILGDSLPAVLAAEMTVAAAVFALPTFFMGAIFSQLVQTARQPAGGVGQAAAFNTFGSALAPAFFGVLLLPALGSKWTLVLISLGYLVLAPKPAGWRRGLLAAPILLTFTLPTRLQIIQMPPGGRLVEYREGVMASVAVIEEATGHRTLRVNNRFQMGGTAAAAAEYRHAHIPLLLHPAPKRALILGLGTGITFGAAGKHPDLQSDGVELVPEVVDVMPQFEPYNFSPARHPRLKLHVADARRFVRAVETRYDVIVADLFHPARDGAGSLYTVEHFRTVRRRLEPGGLFCQWLPLHQLDENMLRIIVRSFLEVFPEAQAWLLHFNADIPVLGLIGPMASPRYSDHWVEKRLDEPEFERQLKQLALADSLRLFGLFLAGPQTLRDLASGAPLNTDDRTHVTFGAPRFVYQKNATSYGRLLTLLNRGVANPRETLGLGPGVEADRFAARLTNYMKARNVYLNGLVEETEGRSVTAIDAYVESAKLSEDFTSGYAQCLTIASLQAKANPAAARALLQRLVEAQPSRPVARQLLQRLSEKGAGTDP